MTCWKEKDRQIDVEGSRKGDDEIKESSVDSAFRKFILEEE